MWVFVRCLAVLSGLCVWSAAQAQFRAEVTGVGMTQVPVAVAAFKGEAVGNLPKISAIVQADLERSGVFKRIDAGAAVLDELSRPDAAQWRARNADALVVGSISRLADGRNDLRARLWDVVKGQDKGEFRDTAPAGDARQAAHRLADWVHLQLTGHAGAFATRMAYVTKTQQRYTLWVADADGEAAQVALASPEPIISPTWSPNGLQLAYVSFESKKPVVYVHELLTGKRRVVANFKGSNSAPAWAPDGRSLVATLSRDGGSQLFRIDLTTGEARKLSGSSTAIDTEASFAPDGQIYFVSDRGASPQIYKMPAQGGAAERVTFGGSYNISPAISPDGRWMAYIARMDGLYKLHLMNLATGQTSAITDTGADERPSFAPNSRLVMYTTALQGRDTLMTSTLDGKVKTKLTGPGGDIREPDWGPARP